MAKTIVLSTDLDCSPQEAWARVQTSELLHHVAAPLIRFVPHDHAFPATWQKGEYRASMLLFGAIPLGWQAIVIQFPSADYDVHYLRDNGYSPLIRRWDHRIEIRPNPDDTTRYTDRLSVDAGWRTPIVAAFARIFYAHRQRRWRALARTGFAALEEPEAIRPLQ